MNPLTISNVKSIYHIVLKRGNAQLTPSNIKQRLSMRISVETFNSFLHYVEIPFI